VGGAIMVLISQMKLLLVEITPTEAKKALTGSGTAKKYQMIEAALRYGITTEHEADALGIAMAASKRVIVEREAA